MRNMRKLVPVAYLVATLCTLSIAVASGCGGGYGGGGNMGGVYPTPSPMHSGK